MEGNAKSFSQKFQVSGFRFQDKGQTLVELLLALGIFAFIMTAVFALVFGGLTTGLRTEEQDYATMYAQEGLDAARSIRDTDWTAFSQNGTHGVANAGSGWSWSGINNEITYGARKFTREIFVENVYRTASGNIFTGSNSATFDYNTSGDYQCEGGDCPSANLIVADGVAKLRGDVRLDNSVNPKELTSTETNLKALYHFNANEGKEINGPGDPISAPTAIDDDPETVNAVGLWHFNENTGQTTADSKGTNTGTRGANSGAEANDPAWTTTGKFSNALSFDGVDDYAQINDNAPPLDTNYNTTDANYATDGYAVSDPAKIEFTGTAVRLKNQATPAEISVPQTNLQALYHFNNSSGAEANKEGKQLALGDLGAEFADANLKALWNFNDNGGTTAIDSSGNGNTGAYGASTAAPTQTTAGKYNRALYFDGVNDYADVGSTASLDSGGRSQMTVEAWIKPVTPVAYGPIIEKKNDAFSAGTAEWSLQYDSVAQKIGFVVANSTSPTAAVSVYSTTNITGSSWFHVVGVYDGSYVRLYINGIAEGTPVALSGTINDVNAGMSIGVFKYGSGTITQYFKGTIDEAAVYDAALTPAQIMDHYRRGVGEDATNSASAFESNDGNTYGPITIASNDGFNQALSFDGVDDYVDIGNVINPGTGDMTAELWMKTTQATIWRTVQKRGTGASGSIAGWQISGTGGAFSNVFFADGVGNYAGPFSSTNYAVNDGNWHHIAVTWQNSTGDAKLYIDGAYKETASKTGVPAGKNITTTRNLTIGAAWDAAGTQSQFFSGSIDEVAIWNTVLPPATIAAHAQGSNYSPASGATVIGPNNPITGLTGYASFIETAIKPSLTSIDYQLSYDNEGTWCHYLSGWVCDGAGYSDAATINANISTFPITNSQIKVKSRLNTTDGSVRPELNNVNIGYLSSSAPLRLGMEQTIEAWVNVTGLGANWDRLIGKGVSGKENYGLWLQSDGDLKFQMSNGGTTCSAWVDGGTAKITAGSGWRHIAGTRAGDTMKLYLDGAEKASATCSVFPLVSTDPLMMGYNSGITSEEYFNGFIDEAAVYNTALGANTIQEHYLRGIAEDATTIEASGGVAANDGTTYGPITTVGNTGLNEALQFDGADDYASIPTPGPVNLNFTAPAAVEGWVKTNSDTCQTIFSISEATTISNYQTVQIGNNCTGVFTTPPELVTVTRKAGGTTTYVLGYTTSTRTELIDNQWHHIAATFDGTALGIKIYIDGQLKTVTVGSGTNNGSFGGITNPTDANIGSWVWNNTRLFYFNGSLDEVAVWNKVLTQQEIWDHIGANVGYQTNSYATVKYNINPSKGTSYIDKFKEFVETATIPAGTSIDYQLSTDNCTTMKYWDGDSWENAGGWNDIRTINRYFEQLTPSSTICLSARLNTTDANQTPVLDNVEIKYSQSQGGAKLTNTTGIDATQTVGITLSSVIGLPTSGSVTIDNEVITYTALLGNVLSGTVTRGTNSTTAVLHLLNAEVKFTLVDPHTKRITSRVKWPSGFSFQDISLTEYLTDWMYPEFITDADADFQNIDAAQMSPATLSDFTISGGTMTLVDTGTAQPYAHAPFNFGTQSRFLKIIWDTTIPTGAKIMLSVRSAPDNGGTPGSWSGWIPLQDIIESNSIGSASLSSISDNQWVQYWLMLEPIPGANPEVNKITIQAKNLY